MMQSPDTHPSRAGSKRTAALPILRPLEILELLDESFDLYKRNFRLFFGIAVLLNTPAGLLALAARNNIAGALAIRAFIIAIGLLTMTALTRAVLERILGRPMTIAAAYGFAARRYPRVLFGGFVYGLAAVIGVVLLVIPGLIVGLYSMLLLPVMVAEDQGWFEMLRRPVELSGNYLWRVFFVALGLGFIYLTISSVLSALVVLLIGVSGFNPNRPQDFSNPLGTGMMAVFLLVSALVQAAWAPVYATAQALTYLDLRIRREAFDLDLLASAVETRVAGERGTLSPGAAAPGQVPG